LTDNLSLWRSDGDVVRAAQGRGLQASGFGEPRKTVTAEIIDLVRVLREGEVARSPKPMSAKRLIKQEPHGGEVNSEYDVGEAREAWKRLDDEIAINSPFVPFAAAFCVIGRGEKPKISAPDLKLLRGKL